MYGLLPCRHLVIDSRFHKRLRPLERADSRRYGNIHDFERTRRRKKLVRQLIQIVEPVGVGKFVGPVLQSNRGEKPFLHFFPNLLMPPRFPQVEFIGRRNVPCIPALTNHLWTLASHDVLCAAHAHTRYPIPDREGLLPHLPAPLLTSFIV